MRRLFELLISRTDDFAKRDRVMALFAPISLLTLPLVWLLLIGFAYTLMFWAIDTTSYAQAMALSGSSLTTLGFVSKETAAERLLAFTEAGWGLILVALMITFLPSIYSVFSRREAQVAMLEVRAGDPPSAVEMLLRHHRIASLVNLRGDNTGSPWYDNERRAAFASGYPRLSQRLGQGRTKAENQTARPQGQLIRLACGAGHVALL